MWEISISWQIISFLYSVALGVVWGLFLTVISALRNVRGFSAIITFVSDFFTFLLFTFITFILLMARCNGEVRGFIIAGEAAGFALYKLTAAKYVLRIFTYFFGLINKAMGICGEWTNRFGGFLEEKAGKVGLFFKKTAKKLKLKRKNS